MVVRNALINLLIPYCRKFLHCLLLEINFKFLKFLSQSGALYIRKPITVIVKYNSNYIIQVIAP